MKNKNKKTESSNILKALSDPTRLSVLEMLLEKDTYVSEFIKVLKIEPTLLSHHLSILRNEDLIKSTRMGKTVLYQLTSALLDQLHGQLYHMHLQLLPFEILYHVTPCLM